MLACQDPFFLMHQTSRCPTEQVAPVPAMYDAALWGDAQIACMSWQSFCKAQVPLASAHAMLRLPGVKHLAVSGAESWLQNRTGHQAKGHMRSADRNRSGIQSMKILLTLIDWSVIDMQFMAWPENRGAPVVRAAAAGVPCSQRWP